jgi:nucleoside-diphosphate-sugar epimerase
MKGKILITGASGFVGYHLVKAAQDAGMDVYAAVRGSSNITHLQDSEICFTTLDLSDKDALQRDFSTNGYDYVIHAAGLTRARNAEEYNLVNAHYARNVAEAAAGAGVKKFILLSSLAALGPVPYQQEYAISETALPNPVTDYGRSKLLAERWVSNIPGLPLIILRPTAVYGPREKDIFIMFRTLHSGIEPYIGRKAQWLSFVYVKDLADIAIKALIVDTQRNVYNISDGHVYDRYALSNMTKKILDRRTLKIHVPLGLVKVIAGTLEIVCGPNKTPTLNKEKLQELTAENWNCSIDKAQLELDYAPRYDLESGLAETLGWYREHKWL